MPRYFFQVFNTIEALDEEGQEFPDLAAAQSEARNAAADLIRDEIKAGRKIHRDHRIEIEDESRGTVSILRFGDLIDDGGERDR